MRKVKGQQGGHKIKDEREEECERIDPIKVSRSSFDVTQIEGVSERVVKRALDRIDGDEDNDVSVPAPVSENDMTEKTEKTDESSFDRNLRDRQELRAKFRDRHKSASNYIIKEAVTVSLGVWFIMSFFWVLILYIFNYAKDEAPDDRSFLEFMYDDYRTLYWCLLIIVSCVAVFLIVGYFVVMIGTVLENYRSLNKPEECIAKGQDVFTYGLKKEKWERDWEWGYCDREIISLEDWQIGVDGNKNGDGRDITNQEWREKKYHMD